MKNTGKHITITAKVVKSYIGTGTPEVVAYVLTNAKAELAYAKAVKNTTVLSVAEYAKHVATLEALVAAIEAYPVAA